jgi:type II secretory pathway pseudopilin PulG
MKRKSFSASGFTTIEVAIIMIIASLLVIPIYSFMNRLSSVDLSEERTVVIRSGLAEHVRMFGHYPCPASLTAARGDVNYDVDTRVAVTDACPVGPGIFSVPGTAGNNVIIGAVPVRTLEVAMDCGHFADRPIIGLGIDNIANVFRKNVRRVSDIFDADTGAAGEDNNNSLHNTNCILPEHIHDEYGSKLIYAISQNATVPTFDVLNPNGQIRINDINNVQFTDNDAVFILVSTGKDRKGAFDPDGNALAPCVATPGITEFDLQNCDLADAIFVDALYSQSAAQFYDDFIDFSLTGVMSEEDFWRWGNDPADPNRRNMLFNQIPGQTVRAFVGESNVTNPLLTNNEVLVVRNGDMRVEGGQMNIRGTAGVRARQNVNAPAGTIEGRNQVISPQFCYDAACNGI